MSRPNTPRDAIAAALRRERQRAGISLTELARRAGIAKSTLSQLESATGNPSVETIWALAVALDIPFSRLVEPPTPRVRVVRAGDGPVIPSETGHFTGTLLASCVPGARHDLYLVTMERGRPREAEPHILGTVEHMIVSTGRVRAGPAAAPVDLDPGDYVAFPGDVEHVYEALTDTATAVLVMEHV